MKRIAQLSIVVLVAVGLLLLGGLGLLRDAGDSGGETPGPRPDAGAVLAPGAYSGLDTTIAVLQQRVRAHPDDWRSLAILGAAYVQQARVVADPSYYPKAEGVLRRSLDLNREENFEALVGLGVLALARHEFAQALDYGERAAEINSFNVDVYGVIGDAQLELGRYADAFATFQRMVDTKPNLASYARVSYARELQGDVDGAIDAMKAALEAAGTPSDAAWASNQLGELYFNDGHPGRAASFYRQGTILDPEFVPPLAGLAKVAWARGEDAEAIRTYGEVVQRYPAPEYVIALADLYSVEGRDGEAAEQERLVRTIQRLSEVNGVNVDLEIALFDADHGDAQAALEAARAEWNRRKSVHVADALAWAQYANGDYERARAYADEALKLGTDNALFWFHAGMIDLRLDDRDAARRKLARALAINPNFSVLHSPTAQATLARLGGSGR